MASEIQTTIVEASIQDELIQTGSDRITEEATAAFSKTIDQVTLAASTDAVTVRRFGRRMNISFHSEDDQQSLRDSLGIMIGAVAHRAYKKGFEAGMEFQRDQEAINGDSN